jgi:hypothetical protein
MSAVVGSATEGQGSAVVMLKTYSKVSDSQWLFLQKDRDGQIAAVEQHSKDSAGAERDTLSIGCPETNAAPLVPDFHDDAMRFIQAGANHLEVGIQARYVERQGLRLSLHTQTILQTLKLASLFNSLACPDNHDKWRLLKQKGAPRISPWGILSDFDQHQMRIAASQSFLKLGHAELGVVLPLPHLGDDFRLSALDRLTRVGVGDFEAVIEKLPGHR